MIKDSAIQFSVIEAEFSTSSSKKKKKDLAINFFNTSRKIKAQTIISIAKNGDLTKPIMSFV